MNATTPEGCRAVCAARRACRPHCERLRIAWHDGTALVNGRHVLPIGARHRAVLHRELVRARMAASPCRPSGCDHENARAVAAGAVAALAA